MSVFSERTGDALFLKANVPSVLNTGSGLATGVYQDDAPEGSDLPYIVFNLQSPEPVEWAFNYTPVRESYIWNWQAFANASIGTLSPAKVAERMRQQALAAIGNELTLIGGGTVTWCAWMQDTPNYKRMTGTRYVYQRGFLLKVSVEP